MLEIIRSLGLTIIHASYAVDSTHMCNVCRTTKILSHSRIRIRRTRGVALHHRLRLSLDILGVPLTRPQTSVMLLRSKDRSLALSSEQKKIHNSAPRSKKRESCHRAISYLIDSFSNNRDEKSPYASERIKHNVLKWVRCNYHIIKISILLGALIANYTKSANEIWAQIYI